VTALRVEEPGLLALLQDRGRYGAAALGLTNGGPVDPLAFDLANRLLANAPDATAIEVSFGGLALVAEADTQVSITGATLAIEINGRAAPMWCVLDLAAGDHLSLGFSSTGCRSYLAVAGGFLVEPSFGSSATVAREGIGGLHGGPLRGGDRLPFARKASTPRLQVAPADRPSYHHAATLRVIPGYQQQHFSRIDQRRFFAGDYHVSDRCDRMGYRLDGPAVRPDIDGILSEGIAMGAIQFPADGQPIVLLNDRQTIGGYPKLGCLFSGDCATLGQLRPGDRVNFVPVSEHEAHNALHLGRVFEQARRLEAAPP
jgi:biotin-dependent carboxylase-like uncharacterized protein